ncbi:MAG: hypothetical protein PF795_02655, partial [Kiritimatiellae bacterium]|nr:hypothetical protein [Kiritimatiellia bacterium]
MSDASERSNAPLFLTELCDLLDLPHPHPAGNTRIAFPTPGNYRIALSDRRKSNLANLNHHRAIEEAHDHIRYLRPDYQNPEGPKVEQGEFETPLRRGSGQAKGTKKGTMPHSPSSTPAAKQPWPKSLPEQLRVLRTILAASPTPLNETQIAK